jgi:hypothetical protein
MQLSATWITKLPIWWTRWLPAACNLRATHSKCLAAENCAPTLYHSRDCNNLFLTITKRMKLQFWVLWKIATNSRPKWLLTTLTAAKKWCLVKAQFTSVEVYLLNTIIQLPCRKTEALLGRSSSPAKLHPITTTVFSVFKIPIRLSWNTYKSK